MNCVKHNLKAQADKIIVIVKEEETVTQGGIIISKEAKKELDETKNVAAIGEVISIGEGYLLQDGTVKPLNVKVGDKVLLNKFGGCKFTYNEIEYVAISMRDVIAVL